MKLEHVAVNVEEPVAMAKWYEEHLGLRIVLANQAAPYMHFLADAGGSMIEIYSNPLGAVPDYESMSPYQFHFSLATTDIEAETERLIAAGARSVDPIATSPAGDRLVFLRDPWGVPLQLVQRRKPLV